VPWVQSPALQKRKTKGKEKDIPRKCKSTELERRLIGGCQGLGRETEIGLNGRGVSFRNVLKLDSHVCPITNTLKT
jgi:hypothetical protein